MTAALAVALVMGGWVPEAWAPQPDKPEKLDGDSMSWNSQAQAFLVELAARLGIANTGESAVFTLHTTLAITDAGATLLEALGPQVDPVSAREAAAGESLVSGRLDARSHET